MSHLLVAVARPSLRGALTTLLEADHHTLTTSSSGSEILRSLENADLLICAEGLEDHDAVDLCRYAQERATPALPALLLCRPGSANLPARTRGLSPFAALQMPFSASDLRSAVDELLTPQPAPTTENEAPPAALGEIDGLQRAVHFTPSGRMRVLWGDPLSSTGAHHLRTLTASLDGLVGPSAGPGRSLAVEAAHRLWVVQELEGGAWLALEVAGGRPLGPVRLHARRAAREFADGAQS